MPEKRWKAQERRVARLLNARRNPHGDPNAPDVENEWLLAEVKDRKEMAQYIDEALTTAQAKAGGKRLPLAVLTYQDSPRIHIVIEGTDFRDFFVGTPRRERR